MANRTLVNSYIASARAESETNSVRLAWLETQRAALSLEIEGGDWETTSTGFDASSTAHRRGFTAAERFDAVIEAVDILTRDEDATKKPAGIYIPRFHEIPHG